MFPERLTRRTFMTRSAASAAGLFLSSCFGERVSTSPTPRPAFGHVPSAVDTRWPIKRVVYLMLENRSFDNLFGRFPGADGTSVGVRRGREVPLIDCPEWLPRDIGHNLSSWTANFNDGRMDGFAGDRVGSFYAYSQFDPHDVPNYHGWAEDFVLSDNMFASAPGPSFPNHLFFIAGQAGGAIDTPPEHRDQASEQRQAVQELGMRCLRRRRERARGRRGRQPVPAAPLLRLRDDR